MDLSEGSTSHSMLAVFLFSGDVCLPKKGPRQSLKILHRFHFTSALRRMSAVISMQTYDSINTNVLAACKGAPETLKGMVRVLILVFNMMKVFQICSTDFFIRKPRL